MLLVSYQPASQQQMAVLLTCAKNDHVTTDNRTLTVNADGVRAGQRARGVVWTGKVESLTTRLGKIALCHLIS